MLIQLIVIQVIAFVIIVVVLKKLLYTETARESDRLKKLKEEFAVKERELQVKIESAEANAAAKIAKSEEDARNFRAGKEKETESLREEIIRKARERAEETIKAAINSKEKIREEIELEMKKKIPVLANSIFKYVLSAAAAELMHNELIEELASRVKKLDNSAFKIKTERGELLSAYPLKKSDSEKIAAAISAKAGHAVSLSEKEDKGLIAGIIVKLGAIVIDGSLENKLKQAEERLG
ncbi:MAG: F0F1 ATP synthase subunit delta [Candidatus Omnitrophota bacterium]|nr:F0F1 ATP synthase subunit delta [Candidatus Omnitrophota bacterium]